MHMKHIIRKILRFGYDLLWKYWPVMILPVILRFRKGHGRWPNLLNPTTFNDKITWRLLFDRRGIYARVSGKFETRDFVRERLGSEALLVPLVGMITHPSDVRRMVFPAAFILKINDGSQMRRIYTRGDPVDLDEMEDLIRTWLRHNYGKYAHEWAYTQVQHAVIVEEFIGSDAGIPPDDVKLNCFDGKVDTIVLVQRGGPIPVAGHYDRDWNYLDVGVGATIKGTPVPPPPALTKAIAVAERLSAGLDYVRIDLFIVGDDVRVGEFTMLHTSGMCQFDPPEFDEIFGRPWVLPQGVGPVSALFGGQPIL